MFQLWHDLPEQARRGDLLAKWNLIRAAVPM